LINSKPNG